MVNEEHFKDFSRNKQAAKVLSNVTEVDSQFAFLLARKRFFLCL